MDDTNNTITVDVLTPEQQTLLQDSTTSAPNDSSIKSDVEDMHVDVTPAPTTAEPTDITSVDIDKEGDTIVDDLDYVMPINLLGCSLDELVTIRDNIRTKLGDDKFTLLVEEIGSYVNIISAMIEEYSVDAERQQDAIVNISDKTLFDTRLVRDGKAILGSAITPRKKSLDGRMVSGTAGRAEFAISRGKVRRIPLYSSGFTIDIATPSLDALNTFFDAVFDKTRSYGRQFGAYFFMYNGLFIKQAFANLFMPYVINSSLRNWSVGNTLLQSIKITDYNTILTALAARIHELGYTYQHVCKEDKCRHVTSEVIDIIKTIRHDFTKMNEHCITHMLAGTVSTPENLSKYYDELSHNNKSKRYKDLEFKFRVPSVQDYLDFGSQFNSALSNSQYSNNTADILRAVNYSYYRIYTPWVVEVTRYNDDDTKDVTTTDPMLIAAMLDDLQESQDDKGNFNTDILEFIASVEITHICYPITACPKCGKVPDIKSGYHTLDAEQTFFTQLVKRLTRN